MLDLIQAYGSWNTDGIYLEYVINSKCCLHAGCPRLQTQLPCVQLGGLQVCFPSSVITTVTFFPSYITTATTFFLSYVTTAVTFMLSAHYELGACRADFIRPKFPV